MNRPAYSAAEDRLILAGIKKGLTRKQVAATLTEQGFDRTYKSVIEHIKLLLARAGVVDLSDEVEWWTAQRSADEAFQQAMTKKHGDLAGVCEKPSTQNPRRLMPADTGLQSSSRWLLPAGERLVS